ncbi:hypothetical protein F4810DRAFT_715829 [Camillea tinctor]|nr:hypothetical protein F4810DRAFT_715829 [Camillea tinctor]
MEEESESPEEIPRTPERVISRPLLVTSPTIVRAEDMEALSNSPVLIGDPPPYRRPIQRRPKYRPALQRDERLVCQTLHNIAKWTIKEISEKLGYSERQVQYACTQPLSPKRRGRHKGGHNRTPSEIEEARIRKGTPPPHGGIVVPKLPRDNSEFNPLDNVWFWLKNWMFHYFDFSRFSLASAQHFAWNALPQAQLEWLATCQTATLPSVIDFERDFP